MLLGMKIGDESKDEKSLSDTETPLKSVAGAYLSCI